MSEKPTKLTFRVELSMTERGWAALHSALIAERAETTSQAPDPSAPLERLLAEAIENGVDIDALARTIDPHNPPWGEPPLRTHSRLDIRWPWLRTTAWWDDRASGRLGYENDEAAVARERGHTLPDLDPEHWRNSGDEVRFIIAATEEALWKEANPP